MSALNYLETLSRGARGARVFLRPTGVLVLVTESGMTSLSQRTLVLSSQEMWSCWPLDFGSLGFTGDGNALSTQKTPVNSALQQLIITLAPDFASIFFSACSKLAV